MDRTTIKGIALLTIGIAGCIVSTIFHSTMGTILSTAGALVGLVHL